MFQLKKLFFICLLLLNFLLVSVFALSAQDTFVIVNSKDWRDVIAGGVYAGQNNYSYVFILTPQQADYIFSFFSESKNPFFYFESENPVDLTLNAKLSSLGQGKIEKQSNLFSFFSSKAQAQGAVVVGSDFGSEAVSVAPYAVFKNFGLFFATKENVGEIVRNLKTQNKEVLLYGSIAKELEKDIFVDKIINTGSVYLDNLELLKLFDSQTPTLQIVFTSGKTYEPFITKGYPVILLGRTEPTKQLIDWLIAHPKVKGLVFNGDEDILGAIQSIKKETGISIFTKLGTGFSKDAKVKPNMVLDLPSKNVVLVLEPPVYDFSSSSLKLRVNNTGNVPAYTQLVIELPNGKFIGSPKKEIKPNSSYLFVLPIDASGLYNQIKKVVVHVYSSSEEIIMESVDVVEFLNVSIENQQFQPTKEDNNASEQSSTFQNQLFNAQQLPSQGTESSYNWFFAIVILIIIVIIYYYGKNNQSTSLNKKVTKGGKKK
ncbi:MAG: hypothetical protein ACK4J0_00695 [Candidatus Anstonellaceae archaeon]